MNDLYSFLVPMLTTSLRGLRTVLEKSAKQVADLSLREDEFLKDALVPDMFPFVKQVQVATDNAKGAVARLAGIEPPKYEDTEQSFAELLARIDTTIAFLGSVTAEQFKGAEERRIVLPYFPDKFMIGAEYVSAYAIPNFYFHVCMAYAIARKRGVKIGKADYIHAYPLHSN